MESLETLFADHRPFHTTLQCRAFITAKSGVTPFGQYRQALRELTSRTWSAFDEMLRADELRIEIEEAEESVTRCEAESCGELSPAVRRAQIALARREIELRQLELTLHDRLREWGEFYAQACGLREQLGFLPGQPLDDARREELEADMFARQFANTMRARVLSGQNPLDENLLVAIESLPEPQRDALLAFPSAGRRADFDAWVAGFPVPIVPAPKALPSEREVRDMLRERFEALPLSYSRLSELEAAPA